MRIEDATVIASPIVVSHSRSGSTSSYDSTRALASLEGIAPSRPPTTTATSEERIPIEGLADIRLKVDAGPGCGGVSWPSGEIMSRYLAYRHSIAPEYLRNKTIVELGSGTGLVGIAAAMLEPAADVWATDQDILLDLMRANGELNLPGSTNFHVAELSWGEEITHCPSEADLVLAADCVYFEPAFPLLVKTLCDLAPVGKDMDILFCWKKRRNADKRFFALLKKHFTSEPVEDDRPGAREVYNREGVSLLRLKRKAPK